jgi:uncharacterized protein YqgV (UPF0045/DUF77 family)
MMKRNLLLVLVSFLIFHTASAQKRKKPSKAQQDLLGTAEYFFDDNQFLRALPYYQKLSETDSTNAYLHYKMGICYLHKSDEKERSITELERAARINPSLADITCYLGEAYHLNNQFDKAIDIFNKYIGENPSPSQKKIASHYIEFCQNGKVLVQKPMDVDIVNLGPPVNTSASEYAPVISSDESTLIFTYKGERSKGGLMDDQFIPDADGDYYEDIFLSQRIGKDWLTPESISDRINTIGNDASIAVSADGQTLFIFKSTTKDNGDIFISTLKGAEWSEPVRLGPTINSNNSWEGSCSISSDGQMLYFASDRKGGFGGRDIYVSKRLPNGEWSVAKNLGPSINTEYDEDAPFIHPDGIDLFFSSRGHSSMGGYDIMYSTKRGESWSDPINLGYPLNTTEDERYYVLTASGEYGYFSSDRKGTLGEQDIYTVNPGFAGERPILALVVGTVTADDRPADAKIKVTNMTTGEQQGEYASNSSSGKFLIALTPGNEYKVAIEVEGMQTHMEYVNVKNIETFIQVNDDVKLYPAGSPKALQQIKVDSVNNLQAKIDQQIAKYRQEQKYEVYEANNYKKIITARGEELHDSVFYQVELGKFECPEEFSAAKLTEFGTVQQTKDISSHTIYYLGPFKTMLEAELTRRKAMLADTSLHGAVLTVNDHGARKTIQQYYATDYKRVDYIIPTDTRLQPCKGKIQPVAVAVPDPVTDQQMKSMVNDHGKYEAAGLSYKLELGISGKGKSFDSTLFAKYGKIEQKKFDDGTIHYSIGNFKNLSDAVLFKDSLIAKEPAAAKSIVMVFDFGKPKTVDQYFEAHPKVVKPADQPCIADTLLSFSAFVGKDLNDVQIYNSLIATAGKLCPEGLTFTVQIGAYRHPENFKHLNLKSLEPPPTAVIPYPDGITRFTMREFKTIAEAEKFRQTAIALGTKDAWITVKYKGERKLLQECIANNFWGKAIN